MAEPDSPRVPYVSKTEPYAKTKIGFMASRHIFAGVGGMAESLIN